MKVNREQLKALIKECLVELLVEGLGNVPVPVVGAPRRAPIAGVAEQRRRQPQPQHARQAFDPRLDTPVSPGRSPSNALKEAVKREAGGNPIMEAIFADTARTTLPSMLQHGDVGNPGAGGGGGHALTQQEQFNGEPEQVFGEDSVGRWADLAFMDSSGKKTA